MIAFSQIPMPMRDLYYSFFAVIVAITLFGFVMNLVWHARKAAILTQAGILAVEYGYLVCLHEAYAVMLYAPEQEISAVGRAFYDMPVLLAWVVAVVLFITVAVGIYHSYGWHKRHIGKTSIKEGIDRLPVGLCFYDRNGLPLLTNNEMNEISAALTGHTVMDGKMLRRAVTAGEAQEGNLFIQTGEAPVVRLPNGRIKSFTCREIDHGVTELIASDLTLPYALGEKLKKENEELRKMNARLAEYGKHIVATTQEKERLAAKIHIHDEMGRLLLSLKKSMQPTASDAEKEALLVEWRRLAALLTDEQNPLGIREELSSYAKALGVRLIISGEIPEEKRFSDVMLVAVKECLTNTYAHANGDELTVTVHEYDHAYQVICQNNGIAPQAPICEGGGLSSLRSMAERAGGTMQIAISPRFMLSLTLPKEKTWIRSMS